MTVKELSDILKDWPDQDQEVMIAYDSDIRMPVQVVTNFTSATRPISYNTDLMVLTDNDEYRSKDQWT